MNNLSAVPLSRSISAPQKASDSITPVVMVRISSDSRLRPLYSRREKLVASLENIRGTIVEYNETLKQFERLKMSKSLAILPTFRSMCSFDINTCCAQIGIDKQASDKDRQRLQSRVQILEKSKKIEEQEVMWAIEKMNEAMMQRPAFVMAIKKWMQQDLEARKPAAAEILMAYDSAKTKLTLSNQKLDSLPEAISRLSFLRDLDLSDNALSSLPDSLQFMERLSRVDIAHNRFSQLPNSLPESLTEMAIIGNPLPPEVIETFEKIRMFPILLHTQEDYETFLKSRSDP